MSDGFYYDDSHLEMAYEDRQSGHIAYESNDEYIPENDEYPDCPVCGDPIDYFLGHDENDD